MKKINRKTLIISLATILVIAIVIIAITSKPKDEKAPCATFYTEDGRVFAQEIAGAYGVSAPKKEIPEIPGKIFVGWDKDLKNVKAGENTDVHAKYLDVKKDTNVFAMPHIYGAADNNINVPVKLMGTVELCGADLVISYDNAVLKFLSFENTDADITVKHDAKAGLIYLRYVSADNATAQVDLTSVNFKILESDSETTELKVYPKEIVKLNANNEIVEADYGVVDSKIYIMPQIDIG